MKLRLVRGENYVEALWARDPRSLWHALRRIIIPLHTQKKRSAMMVTAFYLFYSDGTISNFAYCFTLFIGQSTKRTLADYQFININSNAYLHNCSISFRPLTKINLWYWFCNRMCCNHSLFLDLCF